MKARWSSSRRAIAAVVVLVVVDLVLVALAFGTSRSTGRVDQAGAAPTTAAPSRSGSSPSSSSRTAPTSGTTTPTPSATSTTSSGTAEPVPVTLRLVAVSGDVAWRATQGSCDAGGGAVSVSKDGGRTWSKDTSPARAVLRLQPKSEQSASVVAAGNDCAVTLFSTSTAGSSWAAAGSAADSWYRDPKDPTRVHPPGSSAVQPCEGPARVVDLAPLSTATAQALCTDGAVRTTADRGASWQRSATVPGALAMDSRREAAGVTAYVLRVDPSCSGLQVARAGESTSAVGCVSGATVPGNGAVALSVNGDDGWVQAGDRTWRSGDALGTWTTP